MHARASRVCLLCPVRAHCRAHAEGRAEAIPPAKVRPPRKALALAVAAFTRGGALLLAQRTGRGLFGGLWELPSTEVPRTRARRRSRREWTDAFGAGIRLGAPLGRVERTLTHRALTLRAFRCEVRGRVAGSAGLRFVAPGALAELGIPSAVSELLGRL